MMIIPLKSRNASFSPSPCHETVSTHSSFAQSIRGATSSFRVEHEVGNERHCRILIRVYWSCRRAAGRMSTAEQMAHFFRRRRWRVPVSYRGVRLLAKNPQ
ncbi:hypothetical protein CEXT_692551 [Caerostris extrusa]|uniref:Uncharacterized protein n=1 Tax=Caerostris extrusa TaxID=172846 RepID=A0AAV4W1L7_CAEEX|nr:hypothetical protein CEXT_692551 [Caerostris extrusa]